MVGIQYYVDMGTAAYWQASGLARSSGFVGLMAELAGKFRELIEVFTRIAERTTIPVSQDLTTLYERFMRSPESEALHRRLSQHKATPVLACSGVLA